ncbi:hypothetical protein J1N35_040015 [Gossypium stocksii]|uniref:GRF-type domain-containing protein n=1 Tax=Gossypium stocksii TaxID=47602 RepID=A0A9D3UD67_9ROSI|nr:hypothetical protein J1N35_040015 [Gossypium stocksii]
MDSNSSNSQSIGSVMHSLKKKSSYANVVTSSRKEYVYDGLAVKFHCNKLALRDTSWSDLNPGRRFYGCLDFQDGGCDFFKWYDGKMCNRATELLRQSRDSERNLLKENSTLRKNVMDLIAFEGNHNGDSSAVGIKVKGGFFFGSSGKRHMQLAVANVD